jgi:xylan 1,4-beta-xylosidase
MFGRVNMYTLVLRGVWVGLLPAVLAGCGGGPTSAPDGAVLFRDDFGGSAIAAGWTQEGGDPSRFSLTSRPGFLRMTPIPPPTAGETPQWAVLVREATGDFVLATRLEFDPAADRQLAGLVAAGEDDRTVSFGLLAADLADGTFRGLSAVAEQPAGEDPTVAFRALDSSELYLQMERTGDVFRVSYSTDGTNYFVVGSLTASLSATVRVGIGNIVRENCAARCDAGSAADFDFFEIRDAGTGETG